MQNYKQCSICGKDTINGRQYCSKACKTRGNRATRATRFGLTYDEYCHIVEARRKKYESTVRDKKVDKKCPVCGGMFSGSRNKTYCSHMCRGRAAGAAGVYRQGKQSKPRDDGKTSDGYIYLYYYALSTEHQALAEPMLCRRSDHGDGLARYVLEHRLNAAIKLGRPLARDEVVHHIDGNKRNNNPDNLLVCSRHEHIREHMAERAENRRLRSAVVCLLGCLGAAFPGLLAVNT